MKRLINPTGIVIVYTLTLFGMIYLTFRASPEWLPWLLVRVTAYTMPAAIFIAVAMLWRSKRANKKGRDVSQVGFLRGLKLLTCAFLATTSAALILRAVPYWLLMQPAYEADTWAKYFGGIWCACLLVAGILLDQGPPAPAAGAGDISTANKLIAPYIVSFAVGCAVALWPTCILLEWFGSRAGLNWGAMNDVVKYLSHHLPALVVVFFGIPLSIGLGFSHLKSHLKLVYFFIELCVGTFSFWLYLIPSTSPSPVKQVVIPVMVSIYTLVRAISLFGSEDVRAAVDKWIIEPGQSIDKKFGLSLFPNNPDRGGSKKEGSISL